nr:unnamed protein product [Naegleria fowleri]
MFGVSQESNPIDHGENLTFKIRMTCHGLSTKQLQEHLDWISVSENFYSHCDRPQEEEEEHLKEGHSETNPLSEEILGQQNESTRHHSQQQFKLTPLQRFSCQSLAMQLLKKE